MVARITRRPPLLPVVGLEHNMPNDVLLPADHAALRTTAARGSVILLCCAFTLGWLMLKLFAAGLGWVATGCGAASTLCLRMAFHSSITRLAWFVERRNLGLFGVLWAAALAVGTAIHLWTAPFIDWSLLLYPVAGILAWCSECYLREQRLRSHVRTVFLALAESKIELLLLAAITCAGVSLRLWVIHQEPMAHGTTADEVQMIQHAWNLAHRSEPWPLYETQGGSISLIQPAGAAVAFFGSSLLAVRSVYMLAGVALTPTFYLLARQFVNAPAALFTTSLLTLGFWPTMISVLGFSWLYGSVFQCLGLALLLYGTRRNSYSACAVGGAVLALCLYSYLGNRVMLLAAAPVLMVGLIGGAGTVRHRVGLLLAFITGSMALAIPWVGIVLGNRDLLFGDTRSISLQTQYELQHNTWSAVQLILDNVRVLLLDFFVQPGENWPGLMPPNAGVVDAVTATLIVLGLLYALVRFWCIQNLIVLSALFLGLLEASLVSRDALSEYRMTSIVPALFLAVALLVDRAVPILQSVRVGAPSIMALLPIIAIWNGVTNIHMVAAQLADCMAMSADALSRANAEPVLEAEAANAQNPGQATFVVAAKNFWPLDFWRWAYRVQPSIYFPVPGQDPAHWPVQFGAWGYGPQPNTSARQATFWPLRLAIGQTGATYIVDAEAAPSFLPIVQRAYPNGRTRTLYTGNCRSFSVITYTLTASHSAVSEATAGSMPQPQ